MEIIIKLDTETLAAIDNLTAALVELLGRTGKAEPETPAAETKKKPSKKTEAQAITLEVVRAKLAALSQGGKQAEVKDLINSFGVSKLTDIPEERFPEVLEKAEALK